MIVARKAAARPYASGARGSEGEYARAFITTGVSEYPSRKAAYASDRNEPSGRWRSMSQAAALPSDASMAATVTGGGAGGGTGGTRAQAVTRHAASIPMNARTRPKYRAGAPLGQGRSSGAILPRGVAGFWA